MRKLLIGMVLTFFVASGSFAQAPQSAQTNSSGAAQSAQTNTSSQSKQSASTDLSIQGFLAMPESRMKIASAGPEQRIAREVLHELLMNPYYSVFEILGFQVQGSTVTVSGKAVNPGTKSDAIGAVKHIEGVEHVTDNIELLPPFPDDDRIRRAEYVAIYGYDGLSRYSWGTIPGIHIIVKGGHVALYGYVDNQADKDMVNIRANGVSGVFSVANNLEVLSAVQR